MRPWEISFSHLLSQDLLRPLMDKVHRALAEMDKVHRALAEMDKVHRALAKILFWRMLLAWMPLALAVMGAIPGMRSRTCMLYHLRFEGTLMYFTKFVLFFHTTFLSSRHFPPITRAKIS